MNPNLNLSPVPLLNLRNLDHYTMIVENADQVTKFHVNTLGFKFKYEKLINTGTVPEAQHDMINHVLQLPDNPEALCVVTQGLNERTLFQQFLKKYGEGIHHIAYRVENIEKEWATCQKHNIEITSQKIITDPVSQLRQFFISRKYTSYFIELIERTEELKRDEDFTEGNMRDLALSIKRFL